jgi:hypothetical protein
MRRTYYSEGYLSTATMGDRAVIDAQRLDSVSFQIDSINPTVFSSGVVTVKVSNNGDKWYAYPIATTLSAEGITDALEVAAYRYVALEVTTIQSGVLLKVSVYGEGMSDPDSQYDSVAAGVSFVNTAGGVPSSSSPAIDPS